MRGVLLALLVAGAALAVGPAASTTPITGPIHGNGAVTLLLEGSFQTGLSSCSTRTSPWLAGVWVYTEDGTFVDHSRVGGGGFGRTEGDAVAVGGVRIGEVARREGPPGGCEARSASGTQLVPHGRYRVVFMAVGPESTYSVHGAGTVTVLHESFSSRAGALGVEAFDAAASAHLYSHDIGSVTVRAQHAIDVQGRLVGMFYAGWPVSAGVVRGPALPAVACPVGCELGAPLFDGSAAGVGVRDGPYAPHAPDAPLAWGPGRYEFEANGASGLGPGFLVWADAE